MKPDWVELEPGRFVRASAVVAVTYHECPWRAAVWFAGNGYLEIDDHPTNVLETIKAAEEENEQD